MSTHGMPKNGTEARRKTSTTPDLAFYETPTGVPTSSQIIKEAREKLTSGDSSKRNSLTYLPTEGNPGLIRTISSTRPFTPREEKRTLFGTKSNRAINERPPSSFHIGSMSFDADGSRPISATRLSPIEKPLSSSRLFSNSTVSCQSDEPKIDSRITSPKTSKSRLPPLDVSKSINDSIQSPKITDEQPSLSKSSARNSAKSVDIEDKELLQKWKANIEPMLALMESLYKDNKIEQFCDCCDKLNQLLESHQMFSRTHPKRSAILKIIFKYLDTESDKIKIKISRIILNMKVSSNNLTNICRLLFSISRNTDNDSYFMENDIIDSLLSASKRLSFKENADSVIYFCGTIKNLSENNKIIKKLSNRNIEEILTKIIKELGQYFKDNATLKSEAGHALVQLTATLRNIADLSNSRHKFLSLNIMELLTNILKYYTSDSELMLNVSRIFSKLTLHADCCQELAINNDSCYKSFIKIMIKHEPKQDLIVRIGFILGNLTSRFEESRIKFISEKYSLDTLINTLKFYYTKHLEIAGKELNNSKTNEDLLNKNEPNPNEDVMIKLVRVVANLAINEQAGFQLSNRNDLLDILIKILEIKDLNSEELCIDTIVTINNISFYNSDLISKYSQKLVDSLMKYLLSSNTDAILETFRVFANLSRDQAIRSYLVKRKVNNLAIAYLSSPNRELVYIVIGVLINIMGDPENRFNFKQENGVRKLIDILNDIGPTDWQLSSMVCKVLMNYSEKTKTNSNYSHFDSDEIKLLRSILNELLDEKSALRHHNLNSNEFKTTNENDTENIDEYMNYLWQTDFAPVATLLSKRITTEH